LCPDTALRGRRTWRAASRQKAEKRVLHRHLPGCLLCLPADGALQVAAALGRHGFYESGRSSMVNGSTTAAQVLAQAPPSTSNRIAQRESANTPPLIRVLRGRNSSYAAFRIPPEVVPPRRPIRAR